MHHSGEMRGERRAHACCPASASPSPPHDCHASAKFRHASAQFVASAFTITSGFGCMGCVEFEYGCVSPPRCGTGSVGLLLGSLPAQADSFQQMWMGRVARPPADNEEASVYWEDKWDARGKRFKPTKSPAPIAPKRSERTSSSPISTTARRSNARCRTVGRSRKAVCWTSRWEWRERSAVTASAASPYAAPVTSRPQRGNAEPPVRVPALSTYPWQSQ